MSTALVAQDSATLFQMLDTQHEDWIIARAMEIIESRVFCRSDALTGPDLVKAFLRAKLNGERREVFAAIFLNSSHRVLAYEALFWGTIDQSAVYPRVVVTKALEHNAAALILAHNHPSGITKPSTADKVLTTQLKTALALVDVRVLDHMIVGEGPPYSMAEHGLI